MVRQLFFRQPSRFEYSNKVIKYEIIELKTNDEVLKVLVQSNCWKIFRPIEILAVFTKHVMKMEDDVVTSLNDWMQGLLFNFSCKFYMFTMCLNSKIKLNVLFECKFHFPVFWNNMLVSICLIMYFFWILWRSDLRHSLKGPNPIFLFILWLFFLGAIWWNRFMMLFFLCSLTSKH